MQVIAESPFAATVAAFLQQGQKIAAELVNRVDIFRKLTQVLSQQVLQLVSAKVDARRRRVGWGNGKHVAERRNRPHYVDIKRL